MSVVGADKVSQVKVEEVVDVAGKEFSLANARVTYRVLCWQRQ